MSQKNRQFADSFAENFIVQICYNYLFNVCYSQKYAFVIGAEMV